LQKNMGGPWPSLAPKELHQCVWRNSSNNIVAGSTKSP
jgi:hypothetical protein